MPRQKATAQDLATQYARTDVRKYSFAVRVVDKWIWLPESVRTARGKIAFNSCKPNSKTKIGRKQGQETVLIPKKPKRTRQVTLRR